MRLILSSVTKRCPIAVQIMVAHSVDQEQRARKEAGETKIWKVWAISDFFQCRLYLKIRGVLPRLCSAVVARSLRNSFIVRERDRSCVQSTAEAYRKIGNLIFSHEIRFFCHSSPLGHIIPL